MSIRFNSFKEAKEYLNCQENHTVAKTGKGLEALADLYSKDECSAKEFLSLEPKHLAKIVSQGAKKAKLYDNRMDKVIRPLRQRIQQETERAEQSLSCKLIISPVIQKKDIKGFPDFESAKTYFAAPENQTIKQMGLGLEDLLSLYETQGCSAVEFLSLNPKKLAKSLSQTAKKAEIYSLKNQRLIQELRKKINEAIQKAHAQLLDASCFESEEIQSIPFPKESPAESSMPANSEDHIEIDPGPEFSQDSIKNDLVSFYINQKIRLEDLKDQLKIAKESERHKILQAISKIEFSEINRAQELKNKHPQSKKEFINKLARDLGKSIAAIQGFILGKAYAKAIFENIPSIINLLSSLNPELFQEHSEIIQKLRDIKPNNLNELAEMLNMTKAQTAHLIMKLWGVAQEIDPAQPEEITYKIEREVERFLGVSQEEITEWLHNIYLETVLGLQLNRLGEERSSVYPPSYSKAVITTFEKHECSYDSLGIWTFFSKGAPPAFREATQQWKLFLNPKREEFQSTLDRALNALSKMPYVDGKIILSDTIKRKESVAIDNPCEPKIVFYFNGPNSEKIFKRAIQLLEKEFKDADLIGAPAGKRDRGKGIEEEQWGPSFTKKRNRLMFYVQGGFEESGRDLAVRNDSLSDLFEGDNFYLHKGSRDPLENSPPNIYSIDVLLDQLESNIYLFNQPFHLLKLQNILNRLNLQSNASPEVESWKERIEKLIASIAAQMSIQKQYSLAQLLEYRDGMEAVNNAVNKIFYKDFKSNSDRLDPSKGTVQAKLEYLQKKAEQYIEGLQRLLSSDLSNISWDEIAPFIPPSFQEILCYEMQKDPEKLKEAAIEGFREMLDKLSEQYGISLTEEEKKTILDNVSQRYTEMRDSMFYSIRTKPDNSKIYIDYFFKNRTIKFSSLIILSDLIFMPDEQSQPENIRKFIKALNEEEEKDRNKNAIAINPMRFIDEIKFIIEKSLEKLQNVKRRQEERLQSLKRGETPVIPYYYHATTSEALSVAATGIEALEARSGFGAFVSTEPELRYGYAIFGLPKKIEFTSEIQTFFNQEKAPDAIHKTTQIWAGLDHLIKIHPKYSELKLNFLSAIQQSIPIPISIIPNLTDEEKMESAAMLLDFFSRSVVFRSEKAKDPKLSAWSLNYRNLNREEKPTSEMITIENDEDVYKWSMGIFGVFFDKQFKSMWNRKEIIKKMSAEFTFTFKKTYLHGREQEDYRIPGKLREKINVCLIAPDDEFEEIYRKKTLELSEKKEFKRLSEIKEIFTERGIGSDLIEFIPLSEQLIEKDFLMDVDAKIPRQWNQKA